MRLMTFTKFALATMAAAFLASGCEFTTATEENEGTISLAELQGIVVEPTNAVAETSTTETTTTETTTTPTPVITGGSGIGPVGGGGGFLWKPVSDSTGKLAVLLPPQYTGQVRGVYVASPSGAALESGGFSAVANGGREHYRFSKPGGGYPNGSHAVAMLKAGGSVHWTVPNTGSRTSY